jgi:transposase
MVKRLRGRHNGALRGLKKMVAMVRNEDLRTDKTTFGIIDAHSVQNAGSAGVKGYDAGKNASGIKRHIVVDTQGLPHAVIVELFRNQPGFGTRRVTTANVPGREGAVEMLTIHREHLSLVRTYLADGGYSGEQFAQAVKELCGAEAAVVKRNEPPRSKQHPAQRGTPTEPRSGEGSPLDVDQERFAFLSFAVKGTGPTGYNSTPLCSGAKIISSNCQSGRLIKPDFRIMKRTFPIEEEGGVMKQKHSWEITEEFWTPYS